MNPEGFARAVAALAGADWSDAARLAVAVSGGGDSLALMALAADAFPGRVQVLSFDHGLRPDSSSECTMVAQLAHTLGLPHATLHPANPIALSNVQAQARAARYAGMASWCARQRVPFLLTAHHADDQAETLLMRLARGSGTAGLAGIRPRRELQPGVLLLRPLLPWPRAELRTLVARRGWQPVIDPSNADPRFDRTRARALLQASDWLSAERLAASAAHLADAEAALAWADDRAWASRATVTDAEVLLDPQALPLELQRRLLRRALAHFGTIEPDGPSLTRMADRLRDGQGGTLGTARARVLKSGCWQISAAAPRSPAR